MALYKNNRQTGSTILIAGTGGRGSTDVDSAFDSTSINPVQNKVIAAQFDTIDKILYKRYNSVVSNDGSLILNIDKELKSYDKISFPSTSAQKELIITYKDNTKESIIMSEQNNPDILIESNFSSIEIPQNFTATIYRCVDENEVRKLQAAFNKSEQRLDNVQTELMQTGLLVSNLMYDLSFSFGYINEDGSESVNKFSVLADCSFEKDVNTIIKSANINMTFTIKYEGDDGESQVSSYSLNQENNYTQKITFNADYAYKIAFLFSPEVEVENITDITSKVGIYIPDEVIAEAGSAPISNGNGTWSWRSPENEIQKSSLSWNGLTIEFYKQGRIAWMKASGTLSTNLAISNAFADTIVPLNSFKPTVTDTMDIICGFYKLQINAAEGTGFRLGQGKILSTETSTDITAGTELYFNRMYIC